MTDIVLSIHPRHAENILKGLKTIELRKTLPSLLRNRADLRIYLYATAPVSAVVGYCGLYNYDLIERYWPEDILEDIAEAACITLEKLIEYRGSGRLYSWWIDNAVRYEKPHPLAEYGLTSPPQSFCYVKRAE